MRGEFGPLLRPLCVIRCMWESSSRGSKSGDRDKQHVRRRREQVGRNSTSRKRRRTPAGHPRGRALQRCFDGERSWCCIVPLQGDSASTWGLGKGCSASQAATGHGSGPARRRLHSCASSVPAQRQLSGSVRPDLV